MLESVKALAIVLWGVEILGENERGGVARLKLSSRLVVKLIDQEVRKLDGFVQC